ncbi:MAG TPA: MerR family transcriptional regulator [Thermoanaerobaculia bacterium]|nr:MerR family transcriptional regulator [Thermoanaerobaculia bacterium]
MGRTRPDGYVMISIISERYNIHPQTLRLYEREGLLIPARTGGNTRLYGPIEIRKLEMILVLTRDLGVNLAGVEVVFNLQKEMEKLELEFGELLNMIRQGLLDRRIGIDREKALVKAQTRQLQRTK